MAKKKSVKKKKFQIKDSGDRTQYSTGAQRDRRAGKGRYDLVPPEAIRRVAKIFEGGAIKYDANNWRKGIFMHDYIDSGLRHIYKYMEGWTDEDHLAMGCWNIMCAIATEEMIQKGLVPEDMDDVQHFMPEGEDSLDEM